MSVRRFPGFTVLELIIVMVLISILAAIGIPSLLRGRECAQVRDAGVVLQGVRHAQKAFFIDNFDNNPATDDYTTIPGLVAARLLAADPNDQSDEWNFGTNAGTAFSTATRVGGGAEYATTTVTLDVNGNGGGSHPLSNCAQFE